MSEPINDGGPAFPCEVYLSPQDTMPTKRPGMTLRDYIAVHERVETMEDIAWAVAEALAGPRPPGTYQSNPLEWFAWTNKWTAAVRYARADAMLQARKGGAE